MERYLWVQETFPFFLMRRKYPRSMRVTNFVNTFTVLFWLRGKTINYFYKELKKNDAILFDTNKLYLRLKYKLLSY